jgi:hypothetical protein
MLTTSKGDCRWLSTFAASDSGEFSIETVLSEAKAPASEGGPYGHSEADLNLGRGRKEGLTSGGDVVRLWCRELRSGAILFFVSRPPSLPSPDGLG